RTPPRPPSPSPFPYTTLFRSQPLDQRRLAARRLGKRLTVLHQQLAACQIRPRLLEIGGLSPCDRSIQTGCTRAHLDAQMGGVDQDRKSTRLNSSHVKISYAVF